MSFDRYGSAMTDAEIATFLEWAGVGTLGLGSEAGGYAIPMSFGYDREADRCVFRFSFGEESEKRTFLAADTPVSLSVFDWKNQNDWRSVVLRGRLVVPDPAEESDIEAIFETYAQIASPEVFRAPENSLDFEWSVLPVEAATGRKVRLAT